MQHSSPCMDPAGELQIKAIRDDIEFAEILVPMTASMQHNAERDLSRLAPQRPETWREFQVATR